MSVTLGLRSTASVSPTKGAATSVFDSRRFDADRHANALSVSAQSGKLPTGALAGRARLLVRPVGTTTLIAGTVLAPWPAQDLLWDGAIAIQPWVKAPRPSHLPASIDAALCSPTYFHTALWGQRIAMSHVSSCGGIYSPESRVVIGPRASAPFQSNDPVTAIAAHIPGVWVESDQLWQGMVVALPSVVHRTAGEALRGVSLETAVTSDVFREP